MIKPLLVRCHSQIPSVFFNVKVVELTSDESVINQDAKKENKEMEAMDIYYNMVHQSTRVFRDTDVGSPYTKVGDRAQETFLPLEELKEVELDTI